MRKKRKSFRNNRIPGFDSKKKRLNSRSSSQSGSRKIGLRIILIGIGIPFVLVGGRFYVHIIQQLPDIKEIENFDFKQATLITDRNGEVLYKLFEENRDYISYEEISQHFVEAIIATEDQRFRTNPGIDRKGTLRAGITDLTQGKVHGGSTITQQLIKNIMLTPEKKIERKLKEMILAIKLNNYIRKDIKQKYNNLSSDQIDRRVKEKILELYSNYIFLGNNAYGIETAAQTYFATGASNLTILQAAILAGIPQAPSKYDPYTNKDLLMGEISVSNEDGTPVDITAELKNAIFQRIEASINQNTITFKRDDSAIIDFFKGLLSFKITVNNQLYQVTYTPGRKDSVLARMYEEGYITESEFKKNFFEGLDYEFQRGKIEINAPHFVFWVIQQLEQSYDAETLRKGGLTVKTTLDYDIQQMAEQSVEENTAHLSGYEADNSALLYLDSQNGDVIAYVGSRDYYDESIDGQVDIIQSKRQPGSTIKPFVYALGFIDLAITLDSPIYDIAMSIGNNRPDNADGQFNGLMAIKNALAHSRNLPAIKMFFSVGGESPLKQFLYKLGMKSLNMQEEHYGYPLAIGAAEVEMLELTKAYAHLSARGMPAEVNPILEIRSPDGSLLYQKQPKTVEQIIPSGVAYLLREILANKTNFPPSWINTFSHPTIKFATKSGTTNVVSANNQKLPRDGWFVAYTPSKVMTFWAGNTKGKPLRRDAFGGWLNSPVRKSFVDKLVQNDLIANEQMQQVDVKSVSISKISGKLSNFDTPLAFTQKSLGYIQTLPSEVDDNIKKVDVDTLCNGKPGPLTPPSDISQAYFITPSSIMPDDRDLDNIIERRNTEGTEKVTEAYGVPVITEALTGECEERYTIAELGEITLDLIQPEDEQVLTRQFTVRHQTTSPFKIRSMKVYLDDIELKSFNYNRAGNLIDISSVTIPELIEPGEYTLKVIIFDEKGFSDSESVQITITDEDNNPPYLLEDKIKVTPQEGGSYEVVILFSDDEGIITSGRIEKNGQVVHEFEGNLALFETSQLGQYSYSVLDAAGNKGGGTVDLEE